MSQATSLIQDAIRRINVIKCLLITRKDSTKCITLLERIQISDTILQSILTKLQINVPESLIYNFITVLEECLIFLHGYMELSVFRKAIQKEKTRVKFNYYKAQLDHYKRLFNNAIILDITPEYVEKINAIFVHDFEETPQSTFLHNSVSASLSRSKSAHGMKINQPFLRRLLEVDTALIHYQDIDVLGEASFGKILRGKYGKVDVAFKILHPNTSSSIQKAFLKEAAFLQTVHHPNILYYYGGQFQSTPTYLVLEHLSYSLHNLLYPHFHIPTIGMNNSNNCIPSELILSPHQMDKKMQYLQEICQCLLFLHDLDILHRDLQPSHIYFTNDGRMKITDLVYLDHIDGSLQPIGTSFGGNPNASYSYLAPEIIHFDHLINKGKSIPYSSASNAYAFGVLMNEVLSHCCPYENMSVAQIIQTSSKSNQNRPILVKYNDIMRTKKQLVQNKQKIEEKEVIEPQLQQLEQPQQQQPCVTEEIVHNMQLVIQQCWAEQPEDRFTMKEIIFHLQDLQDQLDAIKCPTLTTSKDILTFFQRMTKYSDSIIVTSLEEIKKKQGDKEDLNRELIEHGGCSYCCQLLEHFGFLSADISKSLLVIMLLFCQTMEVNSRAADSLQQQRQQQRQGENVPEKAISLLRDAGLFRSLIALCYHYLDHTIVLEKICQLVALMLQENGYNQESFASIGGLEVLLAVLKQNAMNRKVLPSVCQAINQLVIDNKNHQASFGMLGGCEILLKCLEEYHSMWIDPREEHEHEHENEEVKQPPTCLTTMGQSNETLKKEIEQMLIAVSTTIKLLVTHTSNQKIFGLSGGCEFIISVLKEYKNFPELVKAICGLVCNLVIFSANRELVYREHGCELIISLLNHYLLALKEQQDVSTELMKQLCWTIKNLAIDRQCEETFVSLGGCEKLLSVLSHYLHFVPTNHQEETQPPSSGLASTPPSPFSMQRWSFRISSSSTTTTTTTTILNPSTSPSISSTTLHTPPPLTLTTPTASSSSSVIEYACGALSNLLINTSTQTNASEHHAIALLIQVLHDYTTSKRVIEQACWVIKNLIANHGQNKDAFGRTGGCEVIIQLIEMYLYDYPILEQLCWVVHNLLNVERDYLSMESSSSSSSSSSGSPVRPGSYRNLANKTKLENAGGKKLLWQLLAQDDEQHILPLPMRNMIRVIVSMF